MVCRAGPRGENYPASSLCLWAGQYHPAYPTIAHLLLPLRDTTHHATDCPDGLHSSPDPPVGIDCDRGSPMSRASRLLAPRTGLRPRRPPLRPPAQEIPAVNRPNGQIGERASMEPSTTTAPNADTRWPPRADHRSCSLVSPHFPTKSSPIAGPAEESLGALPVLRCPAYCRMPLCRRTR